MNAPERAAAGTDAEHTTLIDKITPGAAAAQVALSGSTFLILSQTVSLNAAVLSLGVTAVGVPLIVHGALVLRARGTDAALLGPVRAQAAVAHAAALTALRRLSLVRPQARKDP